jgi:hypothetical protein
MASNYVLSQSQQNFLSSFLGDLTSNVSDNGIGELHSKRVARQIAAALEYMHSK